MTGGMKFLKVWAFFLAMGMLVIAQPLLASDQDGVVGDEQNMIQEIESYEGEEYRGEGEGQNQDAYDQEGEEGYDPEIEGEEGQYIDEQQYEG